MQIRRNLFFVYTCVDTEYQDHCAHPVDFEWDPAKREANLNKHGVDFVDAVEVFAGEYVTLQSPRKSEHREVAIGLLPAYAVPEQWSGRLATVVFVRREETIIRIISARRARKNERDAYRTTLLGGD